MMQQSQGGLLQIEFDHHTLSAIEASLGELRNQKYEVLKKAINATAKEAKTDLVKKAKQEYTVKKGKLNQGSKIQKASSSNLNATITFKGGALDLKEFKTSVSKSGVKAKVRTSGSLKTVQSQRGKRAKAFLTAFSSGHLAIVQRQEGEEYTRGRQKRIAKYGPHIDLTRIKKLLSLPVPMMIGSQSVLQEIAPSIYDKLMESILKEIQRMTST